MIPLFLIILIIVFNMIVVFNEELVAMYRLKVSNCEAVAFPLSPNQAVADFRKRLMLALMRVTAIGLANIACSAGKPFGNCAIYAAH